MPDIIQLLVKASLLLLVLSSGLQAQWQDLTHAFRRPELLLVGFVAVNVVVPLTAIILCLLLPVAPLTKAGLVIMAVSPLAPFAPGKMRKSGANKGFVYGLYVALLLAAVIIVPATIAVLDNLSRFDVAVPVKDMAGFVATSVLCPLVAGVAIATFWPRFAQRAAPIARIAASMVIYAAILFILVTTGTKLIGLAGDGTLTVIVLTVISGIAAGHWLGGPHPEQRIALAMAATTRHPGIAALIAHRNFDDPQVMLAVVLFLVISMGVCAAYGRWIRTLDAARSGFRQLR